MHVLFTKTFHKEISKLRDKKLAHTLETIILEVKSKKHLSEISGLKKLSGYKNAYRIRVGDYRIGIILENNTAIFSAFNNRKEIYKYFP
jgi:mRNA interferase RelE/StbE